LNEDYIIVIAAAVTTASLTVLFALLSKHKNLVDQAARSATLAKELWDAMSSRLLVMDTRIVDLMAKVEVYGAKSSRLSGKEVGVLSKSVSAPMSEEKTQNDQGGLEIGKVSQETEREVLGLISGGPKTSGEIKEVIGRSREHTSRLLKMLFEEGFVARKDKSRPFVYELTEKGRNYLGGN
jgi:Winged helix DNA-binding domain